MEDSSQSSDLNPTEMLWKHIKYKINTFTNPCKYVIKFHVIVQLQTSDQIKEKRKMVTHRLKHMNALNQHRIDFNYKKKRFKKQHRAAFEGLVKMTC